MSKTACWATNRLDIDIGLVYYGYGSRYDLCREGPYQIGLEGLKCMARYDMVWHHVGPIRPRDPEAADDDWAGRYRQGPVFIRFPGLSKQDELERAVAWYKEAQPESGGHGRELRLEYGDLLGHYSGWHNFLRYGKRFSDHDMMARIRYLHDQANEGERGDADSLGLYLGNRERLLENRTREDREWWPHEQFESLDMPISPKLETDEDIVKFIVLACNWHHHNMFSAKLMKDDFPAHWEMVEEQWPIEKIEVWFADNAGGFIYPCRALDVFKSGDILEVHVDDTNGLVRHNCGRKVFYDKTKTYQWSGKRWWDWWKEKTTEETSLFPMALMYGLGQGPQITGMSIVQNEDGSISLGNIDIVDKS